MTQLQKPDWLEEVGDDVRLRVEMREGDGPEEVLRCDAESLVIRTGRRDAAAGLAALLELPKAALSVVAADGAKAKVFLVRKTSWQALASAVWRVA